MNKKTVVILTFYAIIFELLSCKKHKEDPCLSLSPTNAEFRIEEEIGYEEKRRFEVDTVAANSNIPVYFTALDSTATYEWKIGQDPLIHTERSFFMTFGQPYGHVSVQLTVKKQQNKECFPADNGIKTSARNFYILPLAKAPIIGNFEGFNVSNPSKKFTVQILEDGILNLPEGCSYKISSEIEYGSTAVQVYSSIFDPEYGAGAVEGWAVLQKNRNEIVIEYEYFDPKLPLEGAKRIKDTFKGIRK